MTVEELLSANHIDTPSTKPGTHYATCPQCSASRSTAHQNVKCLGVTIDDRGVCWHCNHCNWNGPKKGNANGHGGEQFAATYDYADASGKVIFQKVRGLPGTKNRFWLRRPDGKGGWHNGTKGVDTKLLYRLPEILKAIAAGREIAIAEGEKDCNSLWAIGIPTTCNVGGASEPDKQPKWYREHSEQLRGASITIFNDNDMPGYAHADAIVKASIGVAASIRRIDLAKHWPDIPKGGDISDWLAKGHSREELDTLIANAEPVGAEREADEKAGNGVDRADPEGPKAPAARGLGVWNAGTDVTVPPPRQWLLGSSFCKGFVSSVVGAGGGGKTALRHLQALAVATFRELTGEHVFQRTRVLLVSFEDDDQELRRRILAARLHYDIPASELDGWLFLSAPGGGGGKLVTLHKNGGLIAGELGDSLEAEIRAHDIGLIVLDPLIKTHAVNENDNAGMDAVAQLLNDIATKLNVAVDAPHHVAKGPGAPGNADRGRGASATRDAGRLVFTHTTMSSEEAQAFDIPEDDRRDYFRLDRGKLNIARTAGPAVWFKLVGVPLGNGDDLYPAGDTVQTVELWQPPAIWTALDSELSNRILTAIDAGCGDGNFYTTGNSTTERAAWRVVQSFVPDKSDSQCRKVVATWLKVGLLERFDYTNPKTRREVKGLKVNNTKRPI